MIVTHKGQAHRDEFLACCLLLAKDESQTIFRQDCTEADLNHPYTFVIDQGGQHEPELRNFDHHQMPRGTVCCSIDLVLQHLGYEENTYREILPWAEFSSRLDSTGPNATALHYGMTPEAFQVTLSSVEAQMLHLFAKQARLVSEDPLHKIMCEIGKGLLSYLDKVVIRLKELRQSPLVALPDDWWLLDNTHIPRDQEPSLGVAIHCKQLKTIEHKYVAVIVSQDDRGDGLSLFRPDDNGQVDFCQLEGDPDVVFVHKAGFIAKTVKGADWRSLVSKALV